MTHKTSSFSSIAFEPTRRGVLRSVAAASALALLGAQTARAQSWPDRPIKFIVPFGAGSGTDIVARLVGQKLSEALGQPVVVENKVGASGAIAAEFVSRAAPDGNTVFISTQTVQASNVGMFKKLPYDPLKSFDPVTMLGSIPLLIVVTPTLPVTTVQELMAYARANPGKLTVGYGTGGAQVTAELFKTLAKAEVLLVPYKSNPLAMTAVMSGEINMMVTDPGPSLSQIAAGKLRALAVTTPKRSSIAPNLPTAIESGLAGYDLSAWYCALVPAGTPKPIVTRLNAELARIVAMPDVKQTFSQSGIEAFSSTPEQLQKFMETELVKWSTHIKNAGMVPE